MALDIDFLLSTNLKTNKSKLDTIPFSNKALTEKDSKKKPNKSKSKGNQYENKIAKKLGEWIFNDPYMFTRSVTSGAIKAAYLGDIVPQKQLGWNDYPFLIECKNGYANNASDFNNTTLIDLWLQKCLNERSMSQPIIWLIISFHGHQPLFITDLELRIKAKIIINQELNDKTYPFYVYKLHDLMEYDFYWLYNNATELLKVFNKG